MIANHKNISRKFAMVLGMCLALAPFTLTARADGGPGSAAEPIAVRIGESTDGPVVERLVLGLNKATIIELPADAADVLVSNPAIVDAIVRTPRRVYVLGMQVGQTNAFFFSESGRQILNLEIRVERDLVDLHDALSRHLPNANISVEAINDNIVLSGTVANAAESDRARDIAARYVGRPEQVMNMLSIAGREQVMLKVRVAEMQRTVAKQLGIDLNALVSAGGVPIALSTSNPFSLIGNALSEDSFFNSGSIDGGNNIEGSLRALERAGVMRTLAEPNLTAISGESANFLAGGEFPVPTSRDSDGNVQVTFKPFGVGLGFTPVVLSEGRISLRISTEVSELSSEGAYVQEGATYTDADGNIVSVPGLTIPALRVRRAETTVELPSGGSLVMAGLLQESLRQNIDGFPGLKDTPVLGALFRSRDYQNYETELVIIVTPYLVDPVHMSELTLPTTGFVPASDAETILMGRLNEVYGPKDRPAEGGIEGPVGYIME